MAKKQFTLADAEQFLREHEDKDALVQQLIEWAAADKALRERLIVYAARRADPAAGSAAALKAFKSAVKVSSRDFMYGAKVRLWAQRAHAAIDSFDALLADGQTQSLVEITEHALEALEAAILHVDDSAGYWNVLRARLENLHFQACEITRPNSVELAKRLYRLEMTSEFDLFHRAVKTYEHLFGAPGLEVYRTLGAEAWAKIPALAPGVFDKSAYENKRFRITAIMTDLARQSGDVEQLVAVLTRDLSTPASYRKVAEAYREAEDFDSALHWAEQGLTAFPQNSDPALQEFTASEYRRRGMQREAMEMIWAIFRDRPDVRSYQILERHANAAGDWSTWRERALAELRRRISLSTLGGDHSSLVEIFLYEHSPESAWLEARAGGCSNALWLQVAGLREQEHPADAAQVYLKQAERGVLEARPSSNDEAIALLLRAAALMRRINRSAEFHEQLNALRLKYKPKINFQKLIVKNEAILYATEDKEPATKTS